MYFFFLARAPVHVHQRAGQQPGHRLHSRSPAPPVGGQRRRVERRPGGERRRVAPPGPQGQRQVRLVVSHAPRPPDVAHPAVQDGLQSQRPRLGRAERPNRGCG